jgi:phage terminase large subunit-like protein
MSDEQDIDSMRRLAASAARRFQTLKRNKAFDPEKLDSRPTEQQLEVLEAAGGVPHRWVLGGNQSGKSQLAGRDMSWFLQGIHPYWQRPEEWGNEPLTALIIGRVGTQVEEELWNKKVKPFFEPASYREIRSGQMLQKVKFTNGNTLLFMSHHSPEEAREKAQSYVMHYIWLDEMPNSYKLIEELQRRVQAKRGLLLATFTPKLRNEDIRRMIDTPSLVHKKFKLSMLSNPVYKGREDELMSQMLSLPEEYRKTILEGDWYIGDTAVYQFDVTQHCIDLPKHYAYSWRHIVSVDPAASGKVGLTVWAEDPIDGYWICVKAEKFNGTAGSDLVNEIERKTKGLNVFRRISDPHEVWFIKEAAKQRLSYAGVYKKNERKKELIKGLQEALNAGRIRIAKSCIQLIDEITQCQWSETVKDKIVNSTRFHLLDAAQYFVDNIPKAEVSVQKFDTHTQELRYLNKERKRKEATSRAQRMKRTGWNKKRRSSGALL